MASCHGYLSQSFHKICTFCHIWQQFRWSVQHFITSGCNMQHFVTFGCNMQYTGGRDMQYLSHMSVPCFATFGCDIHCFIHINMTLETFCHIWMSHLGTTCNSLWCECSTQNFVTECSIFVTFVPGSIWFLCLGTTLFFPSGFFCLLWSQAAGNIWLQRSYFPATEFCMYKEEAILCVLQLICFSYCVEKDFFVCVGVTHFFCLHATDFNVCLQQVFLNNV